MLSALVYLSFITMWSYELMTDSLMQTRELLALSLTSQGPKLLQAQTIKQGCLHVLLMLEVSMFPFPFPPRVLAPGFVSSESLSYLNRLM